MIPKKLLLVLFLFIACSGLLKAQGFCGWFPSDTLRKAREKWTLMSDDMLNKEYKKASVHLHWLLVNVPELNQVLYKKGITIYRNLSQSAEGEELKEVYRDSVLVLHDLWVHHFKEDETSILNSKGEAAFELWQENPTKYPVLFSLLSNILAKNTTKTSDYNIKYLMFLSIWKYKEGLSSKEEVENLHQKMMEVVIQNLSNTQSNVGKWEDTRSYINQMLVYL